jgi:preprotein translocase subunit SecF
VYAWSGFEVTPATVLGFLTILGYSLYDAVVVFDMIKEEAKPLGTTKMMTYSDAANSALNHTLIRSLNTSLVALLPVASILVIGTVRFGSSTLQQLSLALFVGILVGTYSSICVATPLLVQLKEREPRYRQLRARLAKQAASSKRQAKAKATAGAKPPAAAAGEVEDDVPEDTVEEQKPSPVTPVRKVVVQGQRQQPKRGTRRERGK